MYSICMIGPPACDVYIIILQMYRSQHMHDTSLNALMEHRFSFSNTTINSCHNYFRIGYS